MYETLVSGEYQVAGLLTTITKDSDRLDMHDIRYSLLERQAQAFGLPWEKVPVASHTSNADYEPALVRTLSRYKESGLTSVVFGDIFREDL
jgi:diphthamide synthase (EF-2-diphthine--ammonia ligase)